MESSLGYLLKEASSALRVSMEAVLRPLSMSITHYSCLELLAQRPGLSGSELARGAFVTRQSMNVLLQALERDGLVVRPEQPAVGRVLPTELTPRGHRQLAAASAAVREVEDRMTSTLSADERSNLSDLLSRCVSSLHPNGLPSGQVGPLGSRQAHRA
ncbi:MarR family winged helix-turn-helix transcriptional regulator [Sanguibacter antarcticus]|uniref:MarR family winged helix-turn-helix transcriptional regulator n=1 Tax=Sanguibacter antarcticus TaxID=372484 RepID=UPI000BF9AC6A|nr:MarR family transcriptional regulator [Sanguibacter antarcticus]